MLIRLSCLIYINLFIVKYNIDMSDDIVFTNYIKRYGKSIRRPNDILENRIFNDNNHYNVGWFTIAECSLPASKKFILKKKVPINHVPLIKSKKILLTLSKDQKLTVNRWFNTCIIIYNATLDYLKKVSSRNFITVRNNLKKTKDFFKTKSKASPFNSEIPTHILDQTIKEAVTNFKETEKRAKSKLSRKIKLAEKDGKTLTNEEKRLIVNCRYKCFTNNKKIMYIEPTYFGKRSIITKLFENSEILYKEKNKWGRFDLTEINKTSILQKDNECYYLYVPVAAEEINKFNVDKPKQNETIMCDLGKRKFITAYSPSNNKVVKIGEGSANNIAKYMKLEAKIDDILKNKMKYNQETIAQKNITMKLTKKKINKLKKNKVKCRRKINNKIDDMQWKTISYLTKNYKNIIVGDFKISSVLRDKKLTKWNKRIMQKLKYHLFKRRLEYKCNIRNCGIRYVTEYNSSKRCSKCGTLNNELGMNEIFKCENKRCKYMEDRDINPCINFYVHHCAK